MERLFRDLVKLGGSDLHLSTESRPMMRVDGDLKEFEGYDALDAETTLRVLLEITPERNVEEFKESGDTDFAYEIEGLGRFRCNLFQDLKGPGGVYRIIPSSATWRRLRWRSRPPRRAISSLVLSTLPLRGPTKPLALSVEEILAASHVLDASCPSCPMPSHA